MSVELTTFYLSPLGDDAWSGRLPEPNADRTDGPFATFAPALEASHRLWAKVPRRIVLRGGHYYGLSVTLTPRDAGLTIEAMPGEKPVLYGGVPITGWRPDGDRFWAAELPQVQSGQWDFRMLQVNGRLCPRARLPQEGAFTHENVFPVRWMSTTYGGWERKPTEEELTTLKYKEGDLGPWLEVRNAEITVYHAWDDSLVGVASLDPATRTVRFSSPAGHPPGAFASWNPHAQTYVVWNVREGMTQPGQWYLDRAAGKVVYWPLPGEDMAQAEVIAPILECIVRLAGEEGAPVRGVTLRGLTLAVTNTPLVAGGFAAEHLPGAILGSGPLEDCSLEGLTIRNVAGHAIKLRGQGNRRLRILGCEIESTGAGGVYLTAEESLISDNLVTQVGLMYPAAIGIFFGGSRNTISYNDISDTSYSGVAGGGGREHRVEYNRFQRVMRVLNDGAAIYMSMTKEAVLRGNVAREIGGGPGARHAYYLDEQCEDCRVTGNLAVGVPSCFHNHMARNNRIEDNVAVHEGDLVLHFPRCANYTLARNILYAKGVIHLRNVGAVTRFERNIFYSAAGVVQGIQFGKERQYDPESVTSIPSTEDTLNADPLFVDAAHEDFRLRPDSPARKLGIRELDVSQAGRRTPKGAPFSLDPFDFLPDGHPFISWERPLVFTKTYYVAQKHPRASDDNPGTEELPFRTVERAAQVLEPGERVVIGEGVYREFVRPARGGSGPQAMISYEAAPGAQVVLSGGEIWPGPWRPSTGWNLGGEQPADPGAKVWQGQLPEDKLRGANPFAMINLPKQARTSKDVFNAIAQHHQPEYWMRRGLLFVDGHPLRQVLDYAQLWREPGTFWVEDDGLTIHLRLADDGDPADHALEFTAREQVFMPAEPYQGYIRVKGLTIEKAGNGIPVPQRGALSTFCGHHWIIEDCTIRWANSIGVDVGHVTWNRASKEPSGYMIVRRNHISDCGVCGLAGVGGGEDRALWCPLVEDNLIERCGWHCVERIYENAGIKLHLVRDGLVRRNIVRDTGYGPGIWLDFNNINARITQNVVLNVKSALFGGIFVEASHRANQVDHNVIWGVNADPTGPDGGGHGIYEHDCDHLLIAHNLIAHCAGTGVYLNLGEADRIVAGRGSTGRKHVVRHNLLADCRSAILFPTPDNAAEENIYGAFSQPGPFRIQRPYERLDLQAWREFHGWDLEGREAEVEVALDPEALRLTLRLDGGEARTVELRGAFSLDALF